MTVHSWYENYLKVSLTPENVTFQVKQHLEYIFSKRNSSNQMTVSMALGLHPWIANISDRQYLAAKRAIRTGWA